MKIKFIDGVCSHCQNLVKVESAENEINELNLKAYKDYKGFSLQVCPNCGYANENIFNNISINVKNVLNSKIYENVKNYIYLDNLNDVGEDVTEDYNANDYEAYSLIAKENEDYGTQFKSLFRAVELKEAIRKNYKRQYLEDLEDLTNDEINDFNNLDEKLEQSCERNLEELLELFEKTNKSIFDKIIYMEVLTRFDEMEMAINVYEDIKNYLSQDLLDYTKNLLD